METLSRTWRLYKESFAVLSADGEILLFPVMSAIAAVLLGASFFIPFYRSGTLLSFCHQTARTEDWLVLFLWYYLNYFVVIFFNAALVACANIRLSGGDPAVRDGLRIALGRIGRIAAWALVAATVGLILRSLSDRRNRWLRWVGKALALGWTLITYLIVPVIVFEDRSVFDSIHRSAELFRQRWGEQVAGSFGFGLLNLLLFLPAVFGASLIWRFDPGAAIILAIVYLLFLATISSAVRGIFTVALYRYATQGTPPPGFSKDAIDPAGWRGYRL